MHGDDCPNWFWPRVENVPKEEIDLIMSPLPAEYAFRPITEANQSSELRLEAEAAYVEFAKGYHRMTTEIKPARKVLSPHACGGLSASDPYAAVAELRVDRQQLRCTVCESPPPA